jgi:hypothetical protein
VDRIGPAADYDASGRSQNYGYGRINALRAVQLATGQAPAGTTLSVTGPAQWSRVDGPPQFQVKLGDRNYYIFEITSRPELFDFSNHQAERSPTNFYGSWKDQPRFTDPTYKLPQVPWQQLKPSPQLYYRVGATPGPVGWDGYVTTTDDTQGAQAPVIELTGDAQQPAARPTIKGPATVAQNDAPPTFQVDPSPNAYYVLELATDPSLFDIQAHGSERNDSNFYGSWSDHSNFSAPTYTVPVPVWNRLKAADRIYYRVGSMAGPTGYDNYIRSTEDFDAAAAPSIQVTAAPVRRDVTTVTFPSGAVFDIVDSPEDGVDYSDPTAGAVVPLIDLQDRMDEDLSRNFKVREFASKDGARYARISPDLVSALQSLRDTLDSPITINSGYRTPAQNQAVGGKPHSRHMAGQAADIASSGMSALDLAQSALNTIGCSIGIGLGANYIHVDVRGSLEKWTYAGAEKNDADFGAWVDDICSQGG